MRRKNWIRLFALALPVLFLLFAAERETWAALPKTYQEFKARYQKEGRTPEGAAKLYFEAVFWYLDPATRDEASKMVRYALHSSQPIEQSYNLATFVERLKYPEYHHIFRGFAKGPRPRTITGCRRTTSISSWSRRRRNRDTFGSSSATPGPTARRPSG